MSGTLILAPEWLGRSGLWRLDSKGNRRPVDAEDVDLPEDLADRLEIWMDGFDALYEEDDPAASDFPNAVARLAFEAEGEAIAAAIREELGDGWQVETDLSGWRDKVKP